MCLSSPDDNFPDIIPKKILKSEEEKLSVSSIEDERVANSYEFYSPQRNTSKSNLYFTENFVSADSQVLTDSLNVPPDVARVRRKIVARLSLLETPPKVTSTPKLSVNSAPVNIAASAIVSEDRNNSSLTFLDVSEQEEFHSVSFYT